ncbi:hypothetical protein M3Y99_01605700 [Aphelenchoides fujianensis]|nr:hypothetical protein M3Y99_01605700 [Aphelenchoides fujianensis]
MNTIAADHQECMGLLSSDTRKKLALSSTVESMPNSLQTIEKPVILMVAPKIFEDTSCEDTRRKFVALDTN